MAFLGIDLLASLTQIALLLPCRNDGFMTLIDYITLRQDVSAAIVRVREAVTSAESPEEVEALASRLRAACEKLSNARCPDAGSSEFKEAARLIAEAKRLLFGLKIVGGGEWYPRLQQGDRIKTKL